MGQTGLIRGTGKIVNRANCGGNKKAGLASSVGHSSANINAIRIRGNGAPNAPFVISKTNQLGGVGRMGGNMFAPNAGGVNKNVIAAMQIKCK